MPLSLGFSSPLEPCRLLLFSRYSHNWFSSFGRIPSALFSFDVRVRNIIHIGLKSVSGRRRDKTVPISTAQTTRLHRWFDAARPVLFETLEYTHFDPVLWKYRIPKLNSAPLAKGFENLLKKKKTLDAVTSSHATRHVLHSKKTAYNWLNFCRELPPCYDAQERPVPHTQFGQIYFESLQACQLAMLLANGKLLLIFWIVIGDDFHVTHRNFTDFPLDLKHVQKTNGIELLRNFPHLEAAMANALQFKRNAGKMVGNYNLARCREITDESDRIFCETLELSDAWEEIELYYVQTVRTDFQSDNG